VVHQRRDRGARVFVIVFRSGKSRVGGDGVVKRVVEEFGVVADRGRRLVVGEKRAGGVGFIGFLTLKLSQPDHASGSTSATFTRLSHVECKPHFIPFTIQV